MHRLRNLLFTGPLKDSADPDLPEGGLLAGLEALNDGEPDDKIVPDDSADLDGLQKIEDEPEIIDKKEPEVVIDDDDLGLPNIGGAVDDIVDKAPEFDSDAFDAETDALVKAFEDKGHPGDVYKDLRSKLKEYESGSFDVPEKDARITELEAEVGKLTSVASEVEAMKEKVASVSSRSAKLLLEESADYKEKVEAPYQEIQSTVAALAEARSINPKEIWDALKENDPVKRLTMLDELEKSIGSRYASEVGGMAKDLRVINHINNEMMANAESIVAAAKEREMGASSKDLESRSEAYKGAAQTSFERYASKVPGFTDGTGNMTDAAKSSLTKSRMVDVNSLESGDLGYMAFSVQALPQALRHIKSLESQIQDLKVATGSASGIGAGKTVKKTGEDKHVNKDTGRPLSFLEGFKAQGF